MHTNFPRWLAVLVLISLVATFSGLAACGGGGGGNGLGSGGYGTDNLAVNNDWLNASSVIRLQLQNLDTLGILDIVPARTNAIAPGERFATSVSPATYLVYLDFSDGSSAATLADFEQPQYPPVISFGESLIELWPVQIGYLLYTSLDPSNPPDGRPEDYYYTTPLDGATATITVKNVAPLSGLPGKSIQRVVIGRTGLLMGEEFDVVVGETVTFTVPTPYPVFYQVRVIWEDGAQGDLFGLELAPGENRILEYWKDL